MTPAVGLGLMLVGIGITAFAGATESMLVVMARSSVRHHLGGSKVRNRAVSDLLDQPFRTWMTLAVLGFTGILVTGAGVAVLAAAAASTAEMLWTVAAAIVAFPLAYLIPRALAPRNLQLTALLCAPALRALRFVLTPALLVLELLTSLFATNGSAELPTVLAFIRGEDPRMLLDVSDDEGILEEGEREMIVSIFELGDTKVREVMVPRIDIVAISIDTSLDEALDTILEAGHSRIPVYRESIDDIAGLLYAKDLLLPFRDRDYSPDLTGLLRDPYFVPESKPVDELLTELQGRKVHMAIVVDEYGGTAGLVTIEDLIEEIVGEIQDEYDVEEARIEHVSEDEGVFHAGIDIDDVNRLMDVQLPTDDVDTLAGLVFTRLGKVPETGEWAHFDRADIEVLAVSGRRIQRVRVVRRAEELVADDEHRDGAPVAEVEADAVD